MKNSASGGARWVDVAPERFPGWVASFARRHGADGEGQALTVAVTGETVIFTAPDGAVAECHPPFPPLADNSKKRAAAEPGARRSRGSADSAEQAGADSAEQGEASDAGGADEARLAAEAVAAHARRPRTVGVLLVRLGGYAAGVFTGYPPCPGRRQDRLAPGARPQRGGRLVAAPLREAPREAGKRGAAGGRRRRGRRVRAPAAAGAPRPGEKLDADRARRGQAGDGGIAAGPAAGALLRRSRRRGSSPSPIRSGRSSRHAAAVPRRPNKAYGADTLIRYPETS